MIRLIFNKVTHIISNSPLPLLSAVHREAISLKSPLRLLNKMTTRTTPIHNRPPHQHLTISHVPMTPTTPRSKNNKSIKLRPSNKPQSRQLWSQTWRRWRLRMFLSLRTPRATSMRTPAWDNSQSRTPPRYRDTLSTRLLVSTQMAPSKTKEDTKSSSLWETLYLRDGLVSTFLLSLRRNWSETMMRIS